ncbi:MAG: thiamine pyrophosphokinase [Acidimicrobiia bacterium]|nr:MAG: thiamine pyrophosphokinase [Acidimicrobiia bacterium]
MRTAVVLAGGDAIDASRPPTLPGDALVIAADSGVHQAEALGLRVDHVVGDLDSADADAIERAVAAGATVERHPEAKDFTDLELALEHAAREGVRQVLVLGGAGGRLDHLLGNVLLLASPRFATMRVEAVVADAHVTVVHGGAPAARLRGEPGSLVTLLPVGGAARGVVTDGLAYPLRSEDLRPGTTRGLSNVMVGRAASVALDAGTLLVVQPDGGTGGTS